MSQPLFWVFALFVGGLILIWGGWQIYKLTTFANEIQVNDFIVTLTADVESYYFLDEGSSKVMQVNLPQGLNYICFKDEGDLDPPDFVSKDEEFLMESREEIQKRLAEIETAIAETKARLPAHSVKPPVMMELLDLEDEYDRLLAELASIKKSKPAGSR